MSIERLQKIKALCLGAKTPGERAAAEAAMLRVLEAMRVSQLDIEKAPKKRRYRYELVNDGYDVRWAWVWKETSAYGMEPVQVAA